MLNSRWNERRENTLSQHNLGQRQGDQRSVFQRDKARILHSAAFRRLQSKTQVLGIGIGDFYRTRLTHSLEAAQIGQGIAMQLIFKYPEQTAELQLDPLLIEALCLAHDIGHPPFGHGGEIALSYMMREHGGFEGNGQTFRIVTKLEPYTPQHGMNLTRRTVLGLVKYPNFINTLQRQTAPQAISDLRQLKASDWLPPKGLHQDDENAFNWLIDPLSNNDRDLLSACSKLPTATQHGKTRYKSFDCSIMELADDIAYSIHDMEDAIVMGIIRLQDFQNQVLTPLKNSPQVLPQSWLATQIEALGEKLFSQEHYLRKDAIGALVNHFISNIELHQIAPEFNEPLLRYNANLPADCQQALKLLKDFVFDRVIRKPEIQQLEYKGQQVVLELFQAFQSDPERLLPNNTKNRWQEAQNSGDGTRIIADYICGMTDEFASRMHANLFLPKSQALQTGQFY